jgi:PAS domain S-box-containing protein
MLRRVCVFSRNPRENLRGFPAANSLPARSGFVSGHIMPYAISAAALIFPMSLAAALSGHPNLHPVIRVSFLLVVSAAAWWAGTGAGMLVSCLAIPALALASSRGRLWLPAHVDPVAILILCFISFLVGRVAASRKRIEEVLRRTNAELEAKVQERTAELQTANTALQHRLAELEQVYEQLPLGLCFLDLNLRYVRINGRLAEFNGAPVAAHLHRRVQEMVPAEMADMAEKLYRNVIETGNAVLGLELNENQYNKAGADRTWLIDCCPVKSPNGVVLGLQIVIQDITERKRAEQQLLQINANLAQREKELRELANAMPQVCWVSHPDGSVAWYNDRWYEYTGIPHGSIDAELWEPTIAPEMLPVVLETWKHSITTRQGFELEIPIRRADGTFRWFLTRTVAMRNDAGELRQWFGTSTDIDDLKRSREALLASERELLRANSDLQQFAYSVSHDLQEPIRNIAVYAQLLDRRYGSQWQGDAQTFLDIINSNARRMADLIRDLLLYVEMENPGQPVSEPADALEALRDALANLSALRNETEAEITIDPLPCLPVRKTQLQQLFQNLVGNALKYRSVEPPKIHISAERQGPQWLLSVRDNGIGIDPAYQQRIFGIFKRLHTTDKYAGTGMGLAICQRIVERYGGRIWVESELGKGSTFFFTLPG